MSSNAICAGERAGKKLCKVLKPPNDTAVADGVVDREVTNKRNSC